MHQFYEQRPGSPKGQSLLFVMKNPLLPLSFCLNYFVLTAEGFGRENESQSSLILAPTAAAGTVNCWCTLSRPFAVKL